MSRRTERLLLAAVLLAWLGVSLPLLLGTSTLWARDVFSVHLPLKAFGAQELAEGRIPYFNPTWGLGEPFRGDPNALPMYPGNLLYLLLPFWSAFNAHYCLHWLLAFWTMRALARTLGISRAGALMAGLTYAGSGWMLSNLTFYNILTVAAWWPLVLLGVVSGDRRGLAIGGLACGLALLGGDPVSATIGIPLMLVVGMDKLGWRRAFGRSAMIGSIGVFLALPQIVATLRILGFATRTAISSHAPDYALHPLRLVELVLPLPWGDPHLLGSGRLLIGPLFARAPFIYSLHIGVVAIVLALGVASRHRRWALASAAGLLIAWLGRPLEQLSQNVFRYPEKFLLWFAVGTALLAGWGLAELHRQRAQTRIALGLLSLCLLLLPITLVWGDQIVGWLGSGLSAEDLSVTTARARLHLIVGAGLSGVLVAMTLWGVRRRQVAILLLLQLLGLMRLSTIVPVDTTAFYRQPAPWTYRAGPGSGVMNGTRDPAMAMDVPVPSYQLPDSSARIFNRISHLDLDYPTGILHGLRYPIHGEGSGLGSPLIAIVRRNLPNLDWRGRANWFRVMGLQFSTLVPDAVPPGMRLLDRAMRFGVPTVLVEIEGVAPRVWWPESVTVPQNADAAYQHVVGAEDPIGAAIAPSRLEHFPGASVRLLEERPDFLQIEVHGDGGLLAIQHAFHPLLKATIDGLPARTLPVQMALLGVEVPPGDHVVEIAVSKRPDHLALLGPGSALLAVGFLWRSTNRRRRPQQHLHRPVP